MTEFSDEAHAAAERVAEAVREALRLLEAVPDASARAQAATLVLAAWPELHKLPREIRQQAVDALHIQGMDFPEIGGVIGTDRSRAWRIWKGMR
jgi:hypothetical protein